jgi:hypothetical protein
MAIQIGKMVCFRFIILTFINGTLPRIAKLTEAGDSSSLMRQLIDAKRNMCERLQKCKEFVFPMPRNGNVEEESDSADDSDFVDVEEKEGFL